MSAAPQEKGWEDATELALRLRRGERSAVEVVEACLARIAAQDGELAAFASTDPEGALRRAREVDRRGAASCGPLAGVPVAFKSNTCFEGLESNCGSRALAGYRAPYSATFAARLVAAGAIPVGMTHMDEFAMGSSGENSSLAVTRNPWDLSRVPGGSSSGSAVAVAADLVPLALGSDTGGSVRLPASYCGVAGFKPSYGRVSRYGLIAFGSSLDQPSPLARSVRDLERVLGLISGADPRDATALREPPAEADRETTLEGLRVGVAPELFPPEVHPGVRERVEDALATFTGAGAVAREVGMPSLPHAIAAYYVVATAEASSNLARYDGVRYGLRREGDGSLAGMIAATRGAGFGDEVKRRILLGTYVLSSGYYEEWYGRATRARGRIARDLERVFEGVDVLLAPTCPVPPFPIGERADDPVAMYATDALTVPASLAGLPAVSVPCGTLVEGGSELPVGLQIIGPRGADARVLAAARRFQERTDHHRARPPASAAAGGTA